MKQDLIILEDVFLVYFLPKKAAFNNFYSVWFVIYVASYANT